MSNKIKASITSLDDALKTLSKRALPLNTPEGLPYKAQGVHGKLLYGQEGLHRVEGPSLNGSYKVGGTVYQDIIGDFIIRSRYTGSEPTIEDIYSAKTYRFMMLGCFDGPLLPLYIGASAKPENLVDTPGSRAQQVMI